MSDQELKQADREINARAKVFVDRFNATPDLIGEYKDFFSQKDIDNILISGFNYQELVNNNASNDKYNYFMKCLISNMLKTSLFNDLNLNKYISDGDHGNVYSNTIFPLAPKEQPIENLFAAKVNKKLSENINREILAGFALNETKPLVPNFAYQYAVKDCPEYNPNWCSSKNRLSIAQFAHGVPIYDLLNRAEVQESPKDNNVKIRKGTVSGNLYNLRYKDESNNFSPAKKEDTGNKLYQKDIDAITIQILNALNVAYAKCGFTHHDIDIHNIIVQEFPESVLIPIYTENIQFDSNNNITDTPYFYISTRYIPILLDYGMAYFEFEGQAFKYVFADRSYNVLYSRKYPSSDIYSLLYLMSRFDERYEELRNTIYKGENDRYKIRNDYSYTYLEALNIVLNTCVYNEDKTKQNGVLSGLGIVAFGNSDFVNPTDLLRSSKYILTPNQKCSADRLHVNADLSHYDHEYSQERMDSMLAKLRTLVDSYNGAQEKDKRGIVRLITFTNIDGVKIEEFIISLDMMCFDFKQAEWIYQFVDSLCSKMTNYYGGRSDDMRNLRDFLKKRME